MFCLTTLNEQYPLKDATETPGIAMLNGYHHSRATDPSGGNRSAQVHASAAMILAQELEPKIKLNASSIKLSS